ncbi:twin-arginine translocation signal domain-containing protein [Pseudomonas parafulva]|uniref:twin-arginine translocation signal domain-containing protein n=1 Tax=Pseudomonas parafulva TaxID=157782 RepID=UPI0018D7B84D|nr:twin-arginine translocation signal domain-containing protein [Pseudomonas parafulva]MBH3345800.1 twin-arginine translocation signal domain-containing protein [Pseudomonas parafulva]
MGKQSVCASQVGRRRFLKGCAVVGATGAVLGPMTAVADQTLPRHTADTSEAFVVINGWVLPSQYFKSPSA